MSADPRLKPKPKMALVVDPRFPGGTSSAVAREIVTLGDNYDLTIHAISTQMFKGCSPNHALASAAAEIGVNIIWDAPVINCEIVAFHNPSCLKFNETLNVRIVCDQAYIVTHENFLRPNGEPGFDIEKCLKLISKSLVCRVRWLAPVSNYNRSGVVGWIAQTKSDWKVAEFDWFNICDFALQSPTDCPRDRRGRVSRAGFEKFPPFPSMITHFPPHAECCRILGGDTLMNEEFEIPSNWEIFKFGSMSVDDFLKGIDFFIYFSHPNLRESFGRVIAEAIAAGKVVITDPGTASNFPAAVVVSDGQDLDPIIEKFIAEPASYQHFVENAQNTLSKFSADTFRAQLEIQITRAGERQNAFL